MVGVWLVGGLGFFKDTVLRQTAQWVAELVGLLGLGFSENTIFQRAFRPAPKYALGWKNTPNAVLTTMGRLRTFEEEIIIELPYADNQQIIYFFKKTEPGKQYIFKTQNPVLSKQTDNVHCTDENAVKTSLQITDYQPTTILMMLQLFITKNRREMEWIYLIIGTFLVILITGSLSSCVVVKTDYSGSAKKNATVYYYLPESIIKIRATAKVAVSYNKIDSSLSGSNILIEQGFVITTEMIADTKDLLSLNYKPSALMADDIKYAVNSKGLLETVNITTEDRTADIISKLAGAPKVILGISAGSEPKTGTSIVKIKEFVSDFAIKASSIIGGKKEIPWNLIILNELGVEELPESVKAGFELSLTDELKLTSALSTPINGSGTSNTEIDGILTRPIRNISIEVKSMVPNNGLNTALPSNVVIADVTKLIVIPVNRTAFVSRINKIGIQDGIILSNEINKPSSVEGFLSIPINIAKAILSILTQLVQFRFDNTTNLNKLEQAKLTYEKSIQDSQKFALAKEEEVRKRLEERKVLDEIKKQLEKQK